MSDPMLMTVWDFVWLHATGGLLSVGSAAFCFGIALATALILQRGKL